ncbi:uncharacterized protein LOC134821076 [Bolinopsis microptera]|uniref:uncharacterized protein LOC134821076 n=1 Tax=Bolinopsis microptera TaxID=2820187 RepID=UPI0030793B0C
MLLLLIVLFAVASAISLTEEEEQEMRLEEKIRNAIWTPLIENTRDELSRLDKSTEQFSAHATCGFSVHTDLSDYETAKQKCENSSWIGFPTPGGRKLASLHSEMENKIATLMFQYAYGGEELEGTRYEGASNWAWIGLEKVKKTEARPEGAAKLVWMQEDWEWTDGTTLDHTSYGNWMTRRSSDEQIQPDMLKVEDDYQTAATIFRKVLEGDSSGVWDDKVKSALHPYICKFNVPVHYIVFPELKTWHEAKSDCERRGFYFAKIRNKAENDLLVEAVKTVYDDHRYDKKFHHENWVWIGATDLKDSGEFEFYDGEPIKFSIPWAKNQHDNKKTKEQGSQDYAAVSRWGEWDDSYGNDWNRPYACQCNPHGVAINKEMEEANAAWEIEVLRKDEVKKRLSDEKENERRKRKQEKAYKKAAKKAEKAERKQNKATKKAERKEEKAAKKKAKKDQKAAKKNAKKEQKAAKINSKKEQKAAKKNAKKEQKAAKKNAKKEQKAAKKDEKKEKKAAEKDTKEELKADNKDEKKEQKAAKKDEKKEKKAAKKVEKEELKADNKDEKKEQKAAKKDEKKEWKAAKKEVKQDKQSAKKDAKAEKKSAKSNRKASKKGGKKDRNENKKDAVNESPEWTPLDESKNIELEVDRLGADPPFFPGQV